MRLKGKNFLLSILLPFRNEEKYLRECLESVLNQSFRDCIALDYSQDYTNHPHRDKHVASLDQWRLVRLLLKAHIQSIWREN